MKTFKFFNETGQTLEIVRAVNHDHAVCLASDSINHLTDYCEV